MEIIQERLEREFNMTVITTVPNVGYIVTKTNGDVINVHNPSELPEVMHIDKIEEPYIKAQIITKSGVYRADHDLVHREAWHAHRPELPHHGPRGTHLRASAWAKWCSTSYDKLKSISRGYASFDYHPIGFKESDLIKLDILLNSEKVDALSALIHRDHAHELGKKMCSKLKELLPRQQFDIPIQAAIGAKIVARETVKALRKDVTAKCYGGDISGSASCWRSRRKGRSACVPGG
jgi:GTP-binding protein LepA